MSETEVSIRKSIRFAECAHGDVLSRPLSNSIDILQCSDNCIQPAGTILRQLAVAYCPGNSMNRLCARTRQAESAEIGVAENFGFGEYVRNPRMRIRSYRVAVSLNNAACNG